MKTEITCAYCGNPVMRVTGQAIYPHRKDLYAKTFWRCVPCHAYVGCHPGTGTPLGRLANAELRSAKMKAHAAFDPVWKSGSKKRGSAYGWLSDKLAIEKKDCHIGMFDVATCNRVVEVCSEASL